jgi:fructose-1,6-bisphosphatase/inositol monophosphatase family enzyme
VVPAFEVLVKAVLEAAHYLDSAHNSRAKLDVRLKADQTMVLNLDVESQRIILAALGSSYPVVAEEDPSSHDKISSESSYYVVDPLDGTISCKRFLGQNGGQVGFGPMVGFIEGNRLAAVAFYSVPHKQLFTAVRDEGSHVTSFGPDFTAVEVCRPLRVAPCPDLTKAGMLFFISNCGEAKIVEHLKRNHAIENVYRFGSFASDSARVAQDFEQIQLQLYAKPWDFPAVLLAAEAGCDVYCDPVGRRIPLKDWRIETNNPIVVLPAGTSQKFFALLDTM